MSICLAPYPAYKDTGLEWLGQIPTHWDVRRFKLLLREIEARSEDGKERLLSVSQYTGVTPRRTKAGSGEADTRAESLIGYKRVTPNDLVVNIMLAWNGSMGVSKYDGLISPAYCIYRFKPNAVPWYYHHLLRQPVYKGRIKTASTGVVESRLRLYSDALFRLEALVPPTEEQEQIARFVADYTRRSERLIHTKRRLIELLNEQKQAIIHRAVTRGIDPGVPLKASGVEWLGELPEHWEVKRMRYVCRMNPSTSELHSLDPETLVSFLPMKKVSTGGELILDENRAIKDVSQGFTYFRDQDIIVAKITPCFENGKAALVNHLCNTIGFGSTEFHVLRSNEGMLPLYLYFIVNSRLFRSLGTGSMYGAGGQKRVPEDFISNFVFAFPPFAEQNEIVTFIQRENAPFDEALLKIRAEINLIREYRTRLVSDVVTGQLDVRGLALPEVEDEVVSLGDEGDELDEGPDEDGGGAEE